MKFQEDKKKAILFYLLEKIAEKNSSVSKTVAEVFGVNQNTVHTYINELLAQNIIRKVKRGQYELVRNEYRYELKRSRGDLESDVELYEKCMFPHIENMSRNIQDIWGYVFSEMINNAMDHSCSERVHVVIMQDYLTTTAAIIDEGVGIFEKIKEHFGLSTQEEAVCELVKGKLTTDSANHSGEGIFFSSKMMDHFIIISSGKVFTISKYDDGKMIDLAGKRKSGTGVIMSLSNFSGRTPQEIFDFYTNEDGGFTKTRIPLKNIFSASPVSRSQAKRVCNRLDKFEEVILDFEGIHWMGQGFAHQIFVVFAKEHSETRMEAVHMEKDVEKMYKHVLAEG